MDDSTGPATPVMRWARRRALGPHGWWWFGGALVGAVTLLLVLQWLYSRLAAGLKADDGLDLAALFYVIVAVMILAAVFFFAVFVFWPRPSRVFGLPGEFGDDESESET